MLKDPLTPRFPLEYQFSCNNAKGSLAWELVLKKSDKCTGTAHPLEYCKNIYIFDIQCFADN